MYIRLLLHIQMGMGRRMYVNMSIRNIASYFRIATELWSMYIMMGPMSDKVMLSGRFIGTLLTLQPLRLALEVPADLITACHLILQGGQAFASGPDLICKVIRNCAGAAGYQWELS